MSNRKNKKQGRNFTLQQVQGIKFQKKDKKVIVAMSGGVDSSVAAGLLKKQGYQVSGVFMIFQKNKGRVILKEEFQRRLKNPELIINSLGSFGLRPQDDSGVDDRGIIDNKCCSQEAQDAAQAVAQKLKIPFYVMDFSGEFQKRVIDYFLAEYKHGRTPNPCVMCNKFIKFGLLLEKALKLGADFVATGHYVKKVSSIKYQVSRGSFRLYEAKDKTRDQSYFLYTLTQGKLQYLLFPLADYLKLDVWQIAKDWNLPIRKTESRGVCFIQNNDIGTFLRRYLKFKKGLIRDINSKKVLGEHQGLPLYTIGQRQAIGIGGTGPYYVVSLDFKKNILWVTNDPKDPWLFSNTLIARDVNWISGYEPNLPLSVKARIRYGHKAVPAEISIYVGRNRATPCSCEANKIYLVKFKKLQRAITPGQAVVFYGKKKELLGGGIINFLSSRFTQFF